MVLILFIMDIGLTLSDFEMKFSLGTPHSFPRNVLVFILGLYQERMTFIAFSFIISTFHRIKPVSISKFRNTIISI